MKSQSIYNKVLYDEVPTDYFEFDLEKENTE